MGESAIAIKGIRDGLLITISQGAWADAEDALIDQIRARGEFFRGARVALEVGELALDREEIRKLKTRLAEHDVQLWALLGTSPETLRSARRMELETELQKEQAPGEGTPAEELPPITSDEKGSSGVLVKHTIRSGRIVRHVGHVVVIGDVNPGAQIIAGGDILVWGRLRGTVHAGATGDEEALVCALDMRPTQLRIANHVAIAPNERQPRPHPEVAFIREGQIMAEEWGS
jgi:septum site-determining protein MinC